MAIVVEHGKHGGSAAAPVARAILRAYFESKGVIKKPPTRQGRYSSGGGETIVEENIEPAGD